MGSSALIRNESARLAIVAVPKRNSSGSATKSGCPMHFYNNAAKIRYAQMYADQDRRANLSVGNFISELTFDLVEILLN